MGGVDRMKASYGTIWLEGRQIMSGMSGGSRVRYTPLSTLHSPPYKLHSRDLSILS